MSRFVPKLGPHVNCSRLTKQHQTLHGPTVEGKTLSELKDTDMSRLVAKLRDYLNCY